jgi:hypothetical protein
MAARVSWQKPTIPLVHRPSRVCWERGTSSAAHVLKRNTQQKKRQRADYFSFR